MRSRTQASNQDPLVSQPLGLPDVVERIDELLELSYRSGDLGNSDNPLDEAIYILLSQQTRQTVYQRVYRDLKSRYRNWLEVLRADHRELLELLRPAGFQNQRLHRLLGLLEAVLNENNRRGLGPKLNLDLTLDYLRDADDGEALDHLTAIHGIGPKTARCILMYAFHRRAFPIDTHAKRILERLGLTQKSTAKPDHKAVEQLIPPKLRKRLHVNLVHHGRAVCRTSNPRCGECVLVSFCPVGQRNVSKINDGKPRALDLFAGAGGLGLGFKRAGYRIVVAIERERAPAQTYRFNHPGVPVLELDARDITHHELSPLVSEGGVDVLIAGPPCQGYSAAGRRDPSDPINLLYQEVTRLARELHPKLILIENVPGVRRVNGIGFADRIKRSLHRSGYRANDPYVVVASEFGVPQQRIRLIYMARRSDLGPAPGAPEPTHSDSGLVNGHSNGLPPTPSVAARLADLPPLGAGVDLEYGEFAGGWLYNASTMRHSPDVVAKIRQIDPGDGPISYRRLEPSVARTLVAGHRALPVHPWLDRAISVREAARIQGFPDDYVFAGTRSSQPTQVADAVPPPMSEALAKHLREYLD